MPERRGRRKLSASPEISDAPTLGQIIRSSRNAQGLTQRDFSGIVSPSYLSRLETDKIVHPASEILEGIADKLSIPVEDLGERRRPERFMARHTADLVMNALRSQILPELRALRQEVADLRAEVQSLKKSPPHNCILTHSPK